MLVRKIGITGRCKFKFFIKTKTLSLKAKGFLFFNGRLNESIFEMFTSEYADVLCEMH